MKHILVKMSDEVNAAFQDAHDYILASKIGTKKFVPILPKRWFVGCSNNETYDKTLKRLQKQFPELEFVANDIEGGEFPTDYRCDFYARKKY